MKRKRSSSKKKVYAVRVGRNPGIYSTWTDAEAQVKGYPGAKFKSFLSHNEAEEFMTGSTITVVRSEPALKRKNVGSSGSGGIPVAWIESGYLEVFTDGSCVPNTGDNPSGWGAVVLLRQPKFSSSFARILSCSQSVKPNAQEITLNSMPASGNSVDTYPPQPSDCDVKLTPITPEGITSLASESNEKKIEYDPSAAIHEEEKPLLELFGPVQKSKEAIDYCGASVGTNNTAELSALIHTLLWIQKCALPTELPILVRPDSEYAYKVIEGIYKGKSNMEMIKVGQKLLNAVRLKHEVQFKHVRAHQGIRWNERADAIANAARVTRERHSWIELENRWKLVPEHKSADNSSSKQLRWIVEE